MTRQITAAWETNLAKTASENLPYLGTEKVKLW